MYKDSLSKLREQVFTQEVPEPAKKTRGLIQARVEARPLDDAKINPYSDWLRTISAMASDIKETTAKSQQSEGSFATGFASTFDYDNLTKKEEKNVDPVDNVPPENREALIRRRGDGPSYYAPRPSKADSFKGLIDKHEGGGEYDTLFSFSNKSGKRFDGVKITEMTIGELKNFANGEYGAWSKEQLGYKATPMGRYQFVGSTLSSVAKMMGLPDDTVFTPEVQDSMFDFWVKETLSKGDTLDEKVKLLRGQWEGFKNVPTTQLQSAIMKYGA